MNSIIFDWIQAQQSKIAFAQFSGRFEDADMFERNLHVIYDLL